MDGWIDGCLKAVSRRGPHHTANCNNSTFAVTSCKLFTISYNPQQYQKHFLSKFMISELLIKGLQTLSSYIHLHATRTSGLG